MKKKEEPKSLSAAKSASEAPNKALASLYTDISPPIEASYEAVAKKDEEKKPAIDTSDEGKLKLFVGGLYFQSEADLQEYFQKFAPIVQCTLIRDKSNMRSRGFAFVTLKDPDGTVRKKIFSTKHQIKGKYVDLKLAESDKKKMDHLNSNKKIFVGGLEPSVDANDLKKYFERFGGVQDAIVLRDVRTNVSRGFGFVTFDSDEAADRCVRENNCEIKEKKVDVKRAEPRQVSLRQSRTYPIPPPDIAPGAPPYEDASKLYGQYPPYPYPPYPYPFPPPYAPQGGPPEVYPPVPPTAEGGKMYPWPYPPMGFPPEMVEGKMKELEKEKPVEERGRSRSKGSVSSKEDYIGPIKDYKGKERTYAPY